MHSATRKYTDAVLRLGLPSRLTSRFVHALDCCLRNRASGDKVLRGVIADVARLLFARSGSSRSAIEQIRETVTAHLEERGVRGSSLLAVVPVPMVLAAEMAQLAAASLGATEELTVSRRRGGRTAHWLAIANQVRDRRSACSNEGHSSKAVTRSNDSATHLRSFRSAKASCTAT